MKILRSELFPYEPQSALRSTQTQMWLLQKTIEEAEALDASFEMKFTKKGVPYWSKLDAKGKEKILRSQPAYARTKLYLDKYMQYKSDLKDHGQKVGFIMPQDSFFMWFLMPMPKSWTKKKKAAMAFKMHKHKKDTDNLSKAIKDALAPRKSNFVVSDAGPADDRVISSYANAKIYIPGEWIEQPNGNLVYSGEVGTLIVEYDLNEFLQGYFTDAMAILNIPVELPMKFN